MSDLELRVGLPSVDARAAYLGALNTCFNGWGDAARLAWCIDRDIDGLRADVLQLVDERERAVSGISLSYRRIALPDGRRGHAAIMTAAWTRPEARGTGAFARIIEECRGVAASRGVPLLLAFVRADNASRRGLERAGATLVPTFYCRSAGYDPPRGDAWHMTDKDRLSQDRLPSGNELTRFVYTEIEWRGQFVERPSLVEALRDRQGGIALLERGEEFDRVLALSPNVSTGAAVDALTIRARAAQRQLFVFTTREAEAARLRGLGFEIVQGFMPVLPTGDMAPPTLWQVQNGDRM